MSDVVLSSAVRSNLASLQSTADLLTRTNNRLSTGLKVGSPIDNPTSFFTAQGLNNRASDLSTLQDNIGLAVETLNAAAAGIDSLSTLVEQAKSTANQALNTKIKATEATVTGFDNSTAQPLYSVAAGVGSADNISITVDGVATTITSVGSLTVGEFISVANAISGLTATVSGGTLTLSATNGRDLIIADTAGSAASDLGLASTFSNGTNRDSFVTDYNALLDQIDQLAGDASFNGVNLLDGNDLTVKFNEDGSSSLTIAGVTYNASGLGLSDTTDAAFSADSGINSVVSTLDGAITRLRTQSSTFGNNLAVVENRQDFTDSLIDILESGAGGLTLADTNEEGANLLALQTRQSLGTTALSLAAQADQAVLSLL